MGNRFYRIAVFFIVLSFVISSGIIVSYARDDEDFLNLQSGKPIIVDGDMVEYFEEDGRIVAEGNVVIEYGDINLTCDRIEVNSNARQAICEGNVRIENPEGVLTGDRIHYDFNRKKGTVIGGDIDAFPWFVYSEESQRLGENEFLLKDAYITTCDNDFPHYRIKGKEIRIFPDDKIIAKDVVYCIADMPVLWVPYYYHPIIQSRAKVQFIPGSDKEWGNFLLSCWRFYIRGDSRVDFMVDYRSKKGLAEGTNIYYYTEDFELDGLGYGVFRWYSIHQNKWGTYSQEPFRDEWRDKDKAEGVDTVLRKRFNWRHRIDFDDDERTVGMLDFNKVSDQFVVEDYFYNEYLEGNATSASYASVTTNQDDFSLSIEARARFHDFYTVTQKFPEAKLRMGNRKLWDIPLYYTAEHTAGMYDKQYALKSNPAEIVHRIDSYHKFSYVTDLELVELTPYGTFRETMYHRTRSQYEPVYRTALGGGVNATSRFYRIFDFSTDFMDLDINQVRHIVSPTIEYTHIEMPNVGPNELYALDAIDSVNKENSIIFSLENKLQTKRHSGEGLTSVDLARFLISTTYNFRMQKNALELVKTGPYRKHGRFSDVIFTLEIDPYNWLFFDSQLNVDSENLGIKQGEIDVTMSPNKFFNMTMGYRYEKLYPHPRNQFTFDITSKLNSKWKVGLYERFDVQKRIIEEQQLVLTRDLHCWEVELIYDVEGSRIFKDQYSVWIAFRIKAFPDLQLGMSRTYSRRKPGCSRPGTAPQANAQID
ncbi:MAG: LPS assembly protein LptD [Candidatus Omnitrophota bacterium]